MRAVSDIFGRKNSATTVARNSPIGRLMKTEDRIVTKKGREGAIISM